MDAYFFLGDADNISLDSDGSDGIYRYNFSGLNLHRFNSFFGG